VLSLDPTVYLIASDRSLRAALLALLDSLPQRIETIVRSGCGPSIADQETSRPLAILLDSAGAGDDLQSCIESLGAIWPGIRILVLADDVEQLKLAVSNGAACLLKGSPATLLLQTLYDVLLIKP